MLKVSKSIKKLLADNKQIDENYKDYLLVKNFISQEYQKINIARLQHLESLQLDLKNKSVIEFGAGIGDHTLYYLIKNCAVLPTDGRKELVYYISKRFGIKAMQLDVEKDMEKILKLFKFDIVHCYGILYHISNPCKFLDSMKDIGKTILLETCVSNEHKSNIETVLENKSDLTQSISGFGCRPSRRWVYDKLRENFKYVYLPLTQPKHKEFPLSWRNIKKSKNNDYLTRAIFIASHQLIDSSLLTTELISNHKQW